MDDKEEVSDHKLAEHSVTTNASVDDFKRAYGEDFTQAIDIDTWRIGENLAHLYPLIEKELIQARQDELKTQETFRETIFPKIKELAHVPHAGLHRIENEAMIEKIHSGFLFNGAVTACGSVSAVYDSLPISITQIGVCLVNYQGQHGSYSHRLFRRDLRFKGDDPIKEAVDLLERRRRNDSPDASRSQLSNLAIRGIRTYAERAILLERSASNWLLGGGSPAPFELMTGFWASKPEMKERSIALMRKMITEHRKFIYVQGSERSQELWTFGNALKPYEYLIIDTLEERLTHMVEVGGTRSQFRDSYQKFAAEVGPQIAVGLYRVSRQAAPRIFYCHVDHVHIAAHIAMADSALQMHLGSPMLLDLADSLCNTAFGKGDFIASIEQAYTKAEVLTNLKN
ncbi:hypothetical protein [Mucilaginibacter sp. KACC 22063]|uniref:hypothetical protein n=1 Tax=Mucilaginibacter sp. KACC 22063 TaxID=3025666 RepID=UPI002367349A|nr:hypothetical protein [Mucilaginibacter sp. KACC 22063]WDF54339.1 hypothetical protein PQ461_15450 [Mucilaginibacter sp. KACC 22063]